MEVRIPRFDYRQQYRNIRTEVLQAIDDVLESGSLILGPHVAAFEQAMCAYLGTGGFAVGVGNCTDALAIALRALGVGPSDEVITVSNTAIATASAIRMVGARPVFCDIDAATLQLDPVKAEKCITPRTRAIIPVHLFGNAVNMKAITRLAGQYGLKIVEDCAQSCGTILDGRLTGTFGDVGCFSFYPTKNLGAYGDGGLCFTRDRKLAEAVREIRTYGGTIRDGVNSRLDEIQAAILEIQLRHLPQYLIRRREVAALYRRHLPAQCWVPQVTPGVQHTHQLFVVQIDRRDRVLSRMRNRGIECGIHYPMPIHLMPAFRMLEYERGSLPITEAAADRLLSLPCYPEMTEEDVKNVCSALYGALAD